jgi:hypothetical protein
MDSAYRSPGKEPVKKLPNTPSLLNNILFVQAFITA